MPKRYTSYRKRTFKRKRKSFRRKSGRNPMQKMANAGIRMKYTRVFTPKFNNGADVC